MNINKDLLENLKKYQRIINLLKNRLPGIEEKTKLIVMENSSLKEENGRLQEDNNELKTKITIKTPNSLGFQQLKEQIKNLKNENSKVTNEKYEKEIELDDEINKLKNRIKELNDEIELLTKQLKSDKTALETQNNKQSNDLVSLNTQLDALKLQYAEKNKEIDALKLEKDKAIDEITKQIHDENEELFEAVEKKNLELEAEVKRLKDAELKRIEAHKKPPLKEPPPKGPPPKGPPSKDFPPNIYVLCNNCIINPGEFHILSGDYTWNTNSYSLSYEKNGSAITFKYNNNNNKWEIKQNGTVVAVSDISNIDITKNVNWTISNTNFKNIINLPPDKGNNLSLFISKKIVGGKKIKTNKRKKTNKRRRRRTSKR
jgi:hypothetical protein